MSMKIFKCKKKCVNAMFLMLSESGQTEKWISQEEKVYIPFVQPHPTDSKCHEKDFKNKNTFLVHRMSSQCL